MREVRHPDVLVVEDDLALRDVIACALQDVGCEIRVASNGRAALRLAEALSPQVMLMDWQLPEMDGAAVLSELSSSALREVLPVIMITGSPESVSTALQHACAAVLPKPFDLDDLLDAVFRVLAQRCAVIPPCEG